jgi:hypothetical protein
VDPAAPDDPAFDRGTVALDDMQQCADDDLPLLLCAIRDSEDVTPLARSFRYARLTREFGATAANWDACVQGVLLDAWLDEYAERTPWRASVLEILQGQLTYLFDAAPTAAQLGVGDDRVVAVWGKSSRPVAQRDTARQRGFIPVPGRWSGTDLDRGHFVAHAAGGGLDMNLFPQSRHLNRGLSAQGKTWQAMERYGAANPGTPLFVRPMYDDATWTPSMIDCGLL